MGKAPKRMTIHFTKERETKNSVRFEEVGTDGGVADPAMIGKLYVKKDALSELGDPEQLNVVLEAGE